MDQLRPKEAPVIGSGTDSSQAELAVERAGAPAQKSHSHSSTPSSSSAEERVVVDSRVPTGGEPEHETKDHGAALLRADTSAPVQTEPLPVMGWSFEMRYGSYCVVNGTTVREYMESLYEGGQTEEGAKESYQQAWRVLHKPSRLGEGEMSWETAARMLGESICANGPNGYGDFTPLMWLTWARSMIGSGTQPLSETSGSNAQERERKNTDSQVVPSLPSADGSIAQAKAKYIQSRGDYISAASRCASTQAQALRMDADLDALILLCQSEAQQEIERLRGVLDADASDLWRITNAIKDEIRARDWVTESRGSYEWDDQRYRDETKLAFDAIRKLIDPVQRHASNRFLEVMRATDKYCYKALAAERQQELTKLKTLINDDGSLTTFDDHVAILEDAIDALNKLGKIEEYERRAEAAESSLSRLQEQRTTQVQEKKEHLGALCATEGDAHPCSVPTPELPHAGAEKWRSVIRFVFFGNSKDTEKLSDDELQTRLCESWDAIQVERDHFSAELKRLVGLLPVSRMEQSSGKFRVARDSDQKCQCGHPQSAHFGVGGMCLGEFRKRDPQYPVVQCACLVFAPEAK